MNKKDLKNSKNSKRWEKPRKNWRNNKKKINKKKEEVAADKKNKGINAEIKASFKNHADALVNKGRKIIRLAGFNQVKPMLNEEELNLM